jgi:hypothetical protein
MSSQPIAPVIPSLTRPAVRAGGRTGEARRLPLATTNQAHRVITGPQPSDPAAIAAICPADVPEHLPSPEPSAHDQHL